MKGHMYFAVSALLVTMTSCRSPQMQIPCFGSQDCPTTFVCGPQGYCKMPTYVYEIQQKQSCPKVFKAFCTSGSQCHCPHEPMVCSNNECVLAQFNPQHQKVSSKTCVRDSDCPSLSVCRKQAGCSPPLTLGQLLIHYRVLDELNGEFV